MDEEHAEYSILLTCRTEIKVNQNQNSLLVKRELTIPRQGNGAWPEGINSELSQEMKTPTDFQPCTLKFVRSLNLNRLCPSVRQLHHVALDRLESQGYLFPGPTT